ncbi:MAG: acyl-CoA dehydrogenase family protein [Reyranellaceae bacterium]
MTRLATLDELYRALPAVSAAIGRLAIETDRQARYPQAGMAILKEAGFLDIVLPPHLGGLGVGPHGTLQAYFDVIRSLSYACASTSQVFTSHLAALSTIALVGSEAQMARYAEVIRRERAPFCFLGSEPTQQWSKEGARVRYNSRAAPCEGGWTVDASKMYATGSTGARFMIVFCTLDGAQDMAEGLLMPVIETGNPNVRIVDNWNSFGQRATASGTVEIARCFVPGADMIGGPGDFLRAQIMGPVFQLGFASQFLGIAESALDFAVTYVNEHARPPAGLSSAAEEPHIQGHIGVMSTQVEAIRELTNRAVALLVEAQTDRARIFDAATAVYRAKVFATKAVTEIATTIFQICGARATDNGFDADRFWRNARTLTLHDSYDKQCWIIGRAVLGIQPPPISTR